MKEFIKNFQSMLKRAGRTTILMIGIGTAIVSILLFFVFFSYVVAPYDPNEFVDDPLLPPSSTHLMGTDGLGRDVFSRTICGTSVSISISFLAMSISLTIGTALGSISGYLGGIVDRSVSFVMDSIWLFPAIIVAMLIVLVLGQGIVNTALAIAIVFVPRTYRIIRSQTLVIKERGFIEAQRVVGAKWPYIITHHIVPFYISSLSVLLSLGMADAVLSVSGLGFLGLGVPPPTPEWGTDLASGRQYMMSGQWWLSVFPGVMIFISVIGLNLFSEGLDGLFKSVRISKI